MVRLACPRNRCRARLGHAVGISRGRHEVMERVKIKGRGQPKRRLDFLPQNIFRVDRLPVPAESERAPPGAEAFRQAN